MLALSPLLILLGLFLPGYFVAKSLGRPLWGAAAFTFSLVILFHAIFWLGVLHIPLTAWTVAPVLLAASALALWFQNRSAAAPKPVPRAPFEMPDRVLLLMSAAVGVVLVAHALAAPLIGGDTTFRWDFLAQRMLALGRFDFYPPLTPADFKTYFFVDGIPPLISFTHWWLYASAGRYLPSLTALFVGAQFACTLAFTYGAAAALFSRRAGVLAMAMLAASSLYFLSTQLGQETGMTAMTIAAMLYFIAAARNPEDTCAMAAAGMAAGLCALTREYGWIALVAGIVALAWRRIPLKQIAVFAAVTVAVAAPWYARNLALTGNPFYSLRVDGLPVNAVHDRLLHYYDATMGALHLTLGDWTSLLSLLLLYATFQLVAGIPGAVLAFRRNGYLAAIALLLVAVWLASVGFTSGGFLISTRVLSPAVVVLSITGAALAEQLSSRPARYRIVVAAIAIGQALTALRGAVYPAPLDLSSPAQWAAAAFPHVPLPAEFQIRDQLAGILPPGKRVLSDSAYLHAALVDKGIEVVPVWSPEVSFLFTATPEEADRRLQQLGIGSVICYPQTSNMRFLTSSSPFYAALPERWRALAQVGDFLYILAPKP